MVYLCALVLLFAAYRCHARRLHVVGVARALPMQQLSPAFSLSMNRP